MLFSQEVLQYVIIGLLVWLAGLSFFVWRIVRHYNFLTKDINKKDLKSLLEKILKDIDDNSKLIKDTSTNLEDLIKQNEVNIQKCGLVRFNPFDETGGNQSFALALMDQNDNGFILSSLHSRVSTRIYTKQLKKGKVVGGGDLSKEEKKAIKQAQKTRK
jgi:hypothetical protein